MLPVPIKLEDGARALHEIDEGIRMNATLEGMRGLNSLREEGVITAGTASQISDGAAAVMIAGERAVAELGLPVRARIHSLAVCRLGSGHHARRPDSGNEKKRWKKPVLSWTISTCTKSMKPSGSVPLAWAKALGADIERLNVNGGAQALGHPLGATGAKLMVTLVHELERRQGRYGLIAICEGGGTANAMIVERTDRLAA